MKYNQDNDDSFLFLQFFCLAIMLYFLVMVLSSCTYAPTHNNINEPEKQITAPQPSERSGPKPAMTLYALSWENTTEPHPERVAWSYILLDQIKLRFDSLNKAKDMNVFCPKYSTLSDNQKIRVWGEFFVALAYYESAWHPTQSSVDVGDEGDYSTYSTGLWQVSAIDREAYNLEKEIPYFSYSELKSVEPNAKLALALMAKQINEQNLICVSSRVYWSTLSCKVYHPYSEIERIANRVQKLEFCK